MPKSTQLYNYFVYWLPYYLSNGWKSDAQRAREIEDGVDEIAWSTYAATGLNAFKNAIPVPIFLTQLKMMRDLPLGVSGPILFGATAGVTVLNCWMEWNKLVLRMKPRHDFAALDPDQPFETGTVYFCDLALDEESRVNVLHYFVLADGNIDVVSLENLDEEIQRKIRNNDFIFTPRETQQLEQLIRPEHKATLKADATFIPGDYIDSTLFWKIAISLTCSIFAGAVLGMSVAEKKSFGEMVFASFMLGTLNYIKSMVTESVVALAAHNAAIQQRHHRSLKPLKEQPFFTLIFNNLFMWFLRDISPALMSVISLASIAQLLSQVSPLLAAVVCIPLYFTATSGFRIFTLSATKKLLSQGDIEFSMENSLSDSKYWWPLGELGSGRLMTVDYPLSKGNSPEAIANTLLIANTLSFVALLYAPLNDYLMCPTQGCFSEGNGSILTFFTDADNLDHFAKNNPAVFPIVFTILLTALFLATALSNLSQLAMIKEYVEKRLVTIEQSKNSETHQSVPKTCPDDTVYSPLINNEKTDAEHTATPTPNLNTSADDQRQVRLISNNTSKEIAAWNKLKDKTPQEMCAVIYRDLFPPVSLSTRAAIPAEEKILEV